MTRTASLLFAAMFFLAACGTAPEERAITGAGLGAAAGSMLGAVTGLSVLDGAIIGTAVGGIAGFFTDKEDLDIGDPFWEHLFGKPDGQALAEAPSSEPTQLSSSSAPRSINPTLVLRTQSGLADLGYPTGPIDGVYGPQTNAAISAYQADHGLRTDGRPSEDLWQHIQITSRMQ